MRRTTWTSLVLIGFSFFSAGRLEAQRPMPGAKRNPVEETAAYLVKAHDSIALTLERMERLQTQMESVSAKLDQANISPSAKAKIRDYLRKSDPLVRNGIGHLRSWEEATGKIKDGMDLYGQIKDIASIAKGLDPSSGDLGTNLKGLSELLDKYGGEVPLLGPFLQAYGQVTGAMLGAIDRLGQNLDERVRQGHVGIGTSHLYPHRNKVLWNQQPNGRQVFEAHTYAPSGPSYAYRPIDVGAEWKRVLLWDEAGDYWYIYDRRLEVAQVYADHLLIDIDLTPAQMARQLRQDIYTKRIKMRQQAEPLFRFLDKNFSAVSLCSIDTTDLGLHRLELFRARYAYAEGFQPRVQAMMRQLFDCMCKKGYPDAAENVRNATLAAGMTDAAQWQCSAGPWTFKLQGGFGGTNPRVSYRGEATVQASGQVDMTVQLDKVVPTSDARRTLRLDVIYHFESLEKAQVDVSGFVLKYTVNGKLTYLTGAGQTQTWGTPPEFAPHALGIHKDATGMEKIPRFFAGKDGKLTWTGPARPEDAAALPTKPLPTPSPITPSPGPVHPPAPQAGEVHLSNATPHAQVSVAPGSILKVHVSLAGGTGYSLHPVPPPAGAATLMRGPIVDSLKTKMPGAPTTYHFDYRIATSPPRTFTIAFRLLRSGASSGPQYDVTVTTLPSASPPSGPAEVVAPTVPSLVAVPNIMGMTGSAARAEIERRGLVFRATGGDPMTGKVSRQTPPVRSMVPRGTAVMVAFEAPAPSQVMIAVPNVLGMNLANATRQLQEAGLVLRSTGDVQNGRVRNQSPTAGSMVPRGSSVNLQFMRSRT